MRRALASLVDSSQIETQQLETADPSHLPALRVRHPPLLDTLLRLLPTAQREIQLQALKHLRQLC
eukprot:1424081-Prymnesium_polylepis.1